MVQTLRVPGQREYRMDCLRKEDAVDLGSPNK